MNGDNNKTVKLEVGKPVSVTYKFEIIEIFQCKKEKLYLVRVHLSGDSQGDFRAIVSEENLLNPADTYLSVAVSELKERKLPNVGFVPNESNLDLSKVFPCMDDDHLKARI